MNTDSKVAPNKNDFPRIDTSKIPPEVAERIGKCVYECVTEWLTEQQDNGG